MNASVRTVELTVNGRRRHAAVEPRRLLADCLREDLGLTGTNLGCEQGDCGACTVRVDGVTVRSCLMFAVQADGAEVVTVEGLAGGRELGALQAAFWEHQGVQCGFCTPGMLMTAQELLERNPTPDEAETRDALSGNLCRCTGYQHIVEAVQAASRGSGNGR
jgi:carbon-monoxide dehydrogenase small subunit